MTRKISKKRYSKRAKRISRRSYRRTYRRKDKRKIKKTRKKNIKYKNNYQTGGAGLKSIFTNAADAIQERLTKIPREESRDIDAINILYNGKDPEEVDETIKEYRSRCYEVFRNPPSDHDDHESRKEQIQTLKEEYSSRIPKYILIAGHGGQIPCGRLNGETLNMEEDPCFTLIPEGYKLILATRSGAPLTLRTIDLTQPAAEGVRLSYIVKDEELNLLPRGQSGGDYFRVYSGGGIINNQIINCKLDFTDCAEYEKDQLGKIVKTEDGKEKCSRSVVTTLSDSGVIVKFVDLIMTDQKETEKLYEDGSNDAEEHRAGGPYNYKKNYSINFQTYKITKKEGTKSHLVIGEGYRPRIDPGTEDQVEIPAVEKYAELFTNSLKDRIDKGLYLESLLEPDSMKEQIIKKAKKDFLDGPSLRLPELDGPPGEYFDLAQLFYLIKEKEKIDAGLPKVILGGFCRVESNNSVANQIPAFINHAITDLGLPRLTEFYFNGDINFADAGELTKQESLASKTKTQDFLKIFKKLERNLGNFNEPVLEKFKTVKSRIDNPTHPEGGIKLSFYDACLVFQMDLYLIKKGI